MKTKQHPCDPVGFLLHIPAKRMNFRAADYHEAVQAFKDWRDCEGYGAREIGAVYPLYQCDASGLGRWRVGTVFYNGRIELNVASIAPPDQASQAVRIAAARKRKSKPAAAPALMPVAKMARVLGC